MDSRHHASAAAASTTSGTTTSGTGTNTPNVDSDSSAEPKNGEVVRTRVSRTCVSSDEACWSLGGALCQVLSSGRWSWSQMPSDKGKEAVESNRDTGAHYGRKTTMMFRNLPEGCTRLQLEQLLDSEGFPGKYDFLYLPLDLSSGSSLGFAFVNLLTTEDAERFLEHFQGFERWPMPAGDKRAVVHVSEALQGLEEQIERYRNSPLMHHSVPEELRPAIYQQGVRVPFPEPTAPVQPPRPRTSVKPRRSSAAEVVMVELKSDSDAGAHTHATTQ